MESALAKHIGYRKDEFHEVLKAKIGHIVNIKGKSVYESLTKVKTTERMLERIIEFQEFAAKEFDYVMEPYRESNDNESK